MIEIFIKNNLFFFIKWINKVNYLNKNKNIIKMIIQII